MSKFTDSLLWGQAAANAGPTIERILRAKRTAGFSHKLQRLLIFSGFPETGRLIWLFPQKDPVNTMVLECPIDDPSPYTMLHALASPSLGRWSRRLSESYREKLRNLSCLTGCSDQIDLTDASKVVEFDFPRNWVNASGKPRIGMQLHPIVSSASCKITQKMTGFPVGGALCTTIAPAGQKPPSLGCGFISRSEVFDGSRFSDSLACTELGDKECGDPMTAPSIFNFTDKSWNDRAYVKTGLGPSILSLLLAYTQTLRLQHAQR